MRIFFLTVALLCIVLASAEEYSSEKSGEYRSSGKFLREFYGRRGWDKQRYDNYGRYGGQDYGYDMDWRYGSDSKFGRYDYDYNSWYSGMMRYMWYLMGYQRSDGYYDREYYGRGQDYDGYYSPRNHREWDRSDAGFASWLRSNYGWGKGYGRNNQYSAWGKGNFGRSGRYQWGDEWSKGKDSYYGWNRRSDDSWDQRYGGWGTDGYRWNRGYDDWSSGKLGRGLGYDSYGKGKYGWSSRTDGWGDKYYGWGGRDGYRRYGGWRQGYGDWNRGQYGWSRGYDGWDVKYPSARQYKWGDRFGKGYGLDYQYGNGYGSEQVYAGQYGGESSRYDRTKYYSLPRSQYDRSSWNRY